MGPMLVAGAVWTALAPGLALVLSGAVRLADAEEPSTSSQRNFVVDGAPFATPLPVAPVFTAAAAPLTGTIPSTRRPVDGS